MAVTARDVAREAGVSPATVSLVFRDKPGIGRETRERVRAVAKQLGFEYEGKTTASKTSTLQLIAYKSHGKVLAETPFFEKLMEGCSDETRRQGFHRLAISYFYAGERPSEQLKSLRSTKSAGIILLATEMRATDIAQFERLGVPIVLLDGWFPTKNLDAIVIDNQRGAFNATSFLVRMGHRRIGYLHSSVNIRNFMERQDGWQQGMRALVDPRYDCAAATVHVGTTIPTAHDDMRTWLDTKPELPTAFFADNDFIAAGCIRALQERGYRVPDDVSVIGLDDVPFSALLDPPLTTMSVPKERMGAIAVQRLVSLIERGRREVVRTSILPEVIERDSVRRI